MWRDSGKLGEKRTGRQARNKSPLGKTRVCSHRELLLPRFRSYRMQMSRSDRRLISNGITGRTLHYVGRILQRAYRGFYRSKESASKGFVNNRFDAFKRARVRSDMQTVIRGDLARVSRDRTKAWRFLLASRYYRLGKRSALISRVTR